MPASGGKKIDAGQLAALRKAFAAAGTKDFDKWVGRIHQQLAQLVVDRTRSAVSSESSSTASALSASRSATGARIRISGAVPQAAGVIYGAGHNVPRVGPSGRKFLGYNQFRVASAGPYYLWPQLDELRDEIARMYADALDGYLTKNGVPA